MNESIEIPRQRPAARPELGVKACYARLAVAIVGSAMLGGCPFSCGGDPEPPHISYVHVGGPIVVSPAVQNAQADQPATAMVYVLDKASNYSYSSGVGSSVRDQYVGLTAEAVAGVELSAPGPQVPCTAAMMPGGATPDPYDVCTPYTLRVAPEVGNEGIQVKLTATWSFYQRDVSDREVAATFEVRANGYSLKAAPAESRKLYAATANAVIEAVTGINPTAPVALSLDGLGSGVTGSFAASPLPIGNQTTLTLAVPARYAGGATIPLAVRGLSAGIARTAKFSLVVDARYSIGVSPSSGTVLRDTPLTIDVELFFADTYARSGAPPPIELSVPRVPDGLTARFDNASVTAFDMPLSAARVKRKLTLSTEADVVFSGPIEIRATALGEPVDAAGDRPYAHADVGVQTAAADSWSYIGGQLNREPTALAAEPFAIAVNNGNPVVGWLEDVAGLRQARLARFNGGIFAPSPTSTGLGGDGALQAPGLLPIDSASLALGSQGTATVAFAYGGGAGIALATADPLWRITNLRQGLFTNAPQVVVAPAGATFVSYVVETHGADPTARLIVARPTTSLAFEPIGGLPGDGALNANASRGVVRADSTSLAAAADGGLVVAWVEFDGALRLWFRAFNGTAWGSPVQVSRTNFDNPQTARIAVGAGGVIYIASIRKSVGWAEPRVVVDASSDGGATWVSLPGDGASLNLDADAPARDLSLTVDSLQRPVVAWAEGVGKPDIWVRRWTGARWALLGSVTGGATTPLANKRTQIAAGANGRLIVTWAQLERSDQDVDASNAASKVLVADWNLY